MKIGIVTTWNARCGIATYSAYLGEELVKQGQDVLILAERKEVLPDGYDPNFGSSLKFEECWDRNKSFEDLLKVVEKEPIQIIKTSENIGYLLGVNLGWKVVNTPFVLLLNNDVLLYPDCITNLVETFRHDEKIGIAGAVQHFANGIRNPPLSWFYRGQEDVGNVYKTEITGEMEELPFVECDLGGGFGCAMIKKDVWEKIGYFDEQFVPCMYEQEDYALRAKEVGFKVVFTPKAKCVHLVAQTTSFDRPYYARIIDINREKFREKWGEKLRKNLI